jgi:hypothetical protein
LKYFSPYTTLADVLSYIRFSDAFVAIGDLVAVVLAIG